MSYTRFTRKSKIKKDKDGKNLCRYCSTSVKPPRRTFCSDVCVHEYRLRTSSSYLRGCVLKRDKGICAHCGANTILLKKQGKQILKDKGKEAYWFFAKSLGYDPRRKSWFDAHHRVAVCDGGGECGLDNIQTLCIPCHKGETVKLFKSKHK